MKKKILIIPLDERPCNYEYQALMAKDTDLEVILPPKGILADKKNPGDPEHIFSWLKNNAEGCAGVIVSIDALVYSSILASRLHNEELNTLKTRLLHLREFKKEYPDIPLYAFSLVMRNPRYSSSDEEPDYYADWGREIHRYGYIGHKKELGIADSAECAEYDGIVSRLPRKYLDDYLERREKNIEINKLAVDLAAEGTIDFLIIPQDDSSPYGLTAKDQQTVRRHILETKTQLTVYMYPDADAVENTLLARMANKLAKRRPLIYVKYASAAGDIVTPPYEDRIVSETIKYQVLAAGGLVASCVLEADLILMVNTPGGDPIEHDTQNPLPSRIEYDANRNQIEQIEYAAYAMEVLKKPVCFGDNAYGNGGDPELLALLREKGLLWSIAGYAGWNTSSNTLGTVIPMAMLYLLYGARKGHTAFLAARYVEDIGYMAFVRREICVNELEARGLDYFNVDGEYGEIAASVKRRLQRFADERLSDNMHRVIVDDCRMPWRRMFEVGIRVHVEEGSEAVVTE